MKLAEDAVELSFLRGDGTTGDLSAGRVIAALPPRLLEATVSFTPALDDLTARRWRNTSTWMAPHAKFFALYDRPFWRAAGLSGMAQSMLGPMQEIHDATTASGDAALFGFIGVPAEYRRKLTEETLRGLCVDQLTRIFGAEAREPRATLLKDWSNDPLTATADDFQSGGHITPTNEPWLTGPWRQRLALSGSEVSPIEPGYLNGAVEAAKIAVAATLQKR
jgi:monoamine oxidase